ncbi:MAG: hypothetical protein HY430_04130 [Candidatus Levybacteria bacterium]|nr:hypothetical protein [Candidatus Levybacteria bacterium]
MKKKDAYIELRIPKAIFRTIPLWLVILLVINSSMLVGFTEYYFMKKNFNDAVIELSKKTKSPEELVQILKQQVIPQKGFALGVVWNDVGKQLIGSGAIDQKKYEELFVNESQAKAEMRYLVNASKDHMVITESNARFMVNTLWAFGLVNKSKLLDEGAMKTEGGGNHMNYASTGGFSLGAKATSELYSSTPIIKLTTEQEELVQRISQNVYRPCCNNPASFPDCNHGMAALGYIELAVSQGLSEKEIYKDVLALNSFWFPQTYVEQAAYFQKQAKAWGSIDPKIALSKQYSSAQGAQIVSQSVQDVPGLQTPGGGCAA